MLLAGSSFIIIIDDSSLHDLGHITQKEFNKSNGKWHCYNKPFSTPTSIIYLNKISQFLDP